jgi:hypothetical protein
LQSIFDVPKFMLNAEILYLALTRPAESVLTGSGLIVAPSQVLGSVGRLAARPCGSEHSTICTPLGSFAGGKKPTPEMLMLWPSENRPPGIVMVGPAAKAGDAKNIAPATTAPTTMQGSRAPVHRVVVQAPLASPDTGGPDRIDLLVVLTG